MAIHRTPLVKRLSRLWAGAILLPLLTFTHGPRPLEASDDFPEFIRAVGYAPWRPGQWPDPPTHQQSAEVIDADMKRIKQAGFNTIRTWASLRARDMAIVQKHGLKVIYGVWLNPEQEYYDPISQDAALRQIRGDVEIARQFPNVIMYLIITELKPSAVLPEHQATTEAFFRRILREIKAMDPKPVSMDSWLPLVFLDHSMWDVVTFNTFEFAPAAITKALTFEGYNNWLRTRVARGKPYFVGETGGFSVSPSATGSQGGSGGHSEKEQSRLNFGSLRAVQATGAIGWTLVSWVDTWHYPSDPKTHNPQEPWEWDGVIGFKDAEDTIGTPRRIFYDLPAFNRQTARRPYPESVPLDPVQVTVVVSSAADRSLRMRVSAQTQDGTVTAHHAVTAAFFMPEPWQERTGSCVTDERGRCEIVSPLRLERPDQILFAAAGVRDRKGKYLGGDIAYHLNPALPKP